MRLEREGENGKNKHKENDPVVQIENSSEEMIREKNKEILPLKKQVDVLQEKLGKKGRIEVKALSK